MAFILFFSMLHAKIVQGCDEPDAQQWIFVGCVPNPQECYYSCPSIGTYRAEEDLKLCIEEELHWACYCPR